MSAQDVQKLRQETGAGIMECKRALDEAKGNVELAKEVLVKNGIIKANKKGDRVAGAGYFEAYIHAGRTAVLLQIHAETDFVTKSDEFQEAAKNIAMHIAANSPETVEELLAQPYVRNPGQTVDEYIKGIIAKVGENIQIARFTNYVL